MDCPGRTETTDARRPSLEQERDELAAMLRQVRKSGYVPYVLTNKVDALLARIDSKKEEGSTDE